MCRKRTLPIAAALSALAATTALAASTPSGIKTTARSEVRPVAADDWFAWSQSPARKTSPFDLYAQRAGGKPFRVNRKAYAGGINGTTLVYQTIRGTHPRLSDLKLYDLSTKRPKPLPAGINSRRWECCGSISGDWLLFQRGRPSSTGRQLVLFWNLLTGEQRVIDTLQAHRGQLHAAQLNGTFAVWWRCNPWPQCRVFRYDVASASTTALTIPAGKIAYAASVNQFGTVYYAQRGGGCGNEVELMKQPLIGPPELLATLPRGRDVGVSYAHAPSAKPPSDLVTTHVYFDQRGCGKQRRWDIFRLNDTERIPGP
jgi:hypothetical protein